MFIFNMVSELVNTVASILLVVGTIFCKTLNAVCTLWFIGGCELLWPSRLPFEDHNGPFGSAKHWFQVHIKSEDSPIEVWKTLASLFDKSDEVSAYYLERKLHELDPRDFERIEQLLAKVKSINEKLDQCGNDYKKSDAALIILVERKLSPIYDIFIQTRARAIKISIGRHKPLPDFEEFSKGLINEQNKLISSGQIVIGQAHVAHGNKFQAKGSKKNFKHGCDHTSGNACQPPNNVNAGTSIKKKYKPCRYCGKTNHLEKNYFKRQRELAK
eukprot:Gb_00331 [translate_table: standard]